MWSKNMNVAVGRKAARWPGGCRVQLTAEEGERLRWQIATSNVGRGGRRYAPYAFTEQGVAMLSSVLKGERAAEVNVSIMRTFVRLRQLLATNEELARKVAQHDKQIGVLFEHVQKILTPAKPEKNRIGFPTKS